MCRCVDGLILPACCVFLILFRALELQPFSLKPLLRRAMAYESLERYRKAYVDYKTVLQIDSGVQAAHDSVHRSAGICFVVFFSTLIIFELLI